MDPREGLGDRRRGAPEVTSRALVRCPDDLRTTTVAGDALAVREAGKSRRHIRRRPSHLDFGQTP
jgi:hypothetical protein